MIFNILLTSFILVIYSLLSKSHRPKKINNIIFLCICFIVFVTLFSIRAFTVGADTQNYKNFFDYVVNVRFEALSYKYYEKGFIILNILISFITSSPRVFFAIIGIIIYSLLLNTVEKETEDPLICILMFINLGPFYDSLNILRQFLALSIVIFSIRYIRKGKLFKFICSILLASTIHITAILTIALYPILRLKSNKKVIIITIIGAIIAYIGIHCILRSPADSDAF